MTRNISGIDCKRRSATLIAYCFSIRGLKPTATGVAALCGERLAIRRITQTVSQLRHSPAAS
jgi:hypothetical protein